MTDPLIDLDTLLDMIDQAMAEEDPALVAADAVLAYLRSVLTPETLQTYRTATGYYSTSVQMGIDMHRRIFGEDT